MKCNAGIKFRDNGTLGHVNKNALLAILES